MPTRLLLPPVRAEWASRVRDALFWVALSSGIVLPGWAWTVPAKAETEESAADFSEDPAGFSKRLL